jgi:cell division protein FtsI/penicillin-binding protein 2
MPGLKGAVDFGTARRIAAGSSEMIYGKTGTCTDERSPTHLGWFGSFMETPRGRLVVTVLLTGGRPVSGPLAAGVAGQIYRNMENSGYFLAKIEELRQLQQPEASLIPGFSNTGTTAPSRLAAR